MHGSTTSSNGAQQSLHLLDFSLSRQTFSISKIYHRLCHIFFNFHFRWRTLKEQIFHKEDVSRAHLCRTFFYYSIKIKNINWFAVLWLQVTERYVSINNCYQINKAINLPGCPPCPANFTPIHFPGSLYKCPIFHILFSNLVDGTFPCSPLWRSRKVIRVHK